MKNKTIIEILSSLFILGLIIAGSLFFGSSNVVRADDAAVSGSAIILEEDEEEEEEDDEDDDDEDYALDLVMNFRATKITKNSVTLAWDKVEDIDGYELSYKKSSAKTWTIEKIAASKTKYVVKDLKVGTKYNFRIRVYLDYTLDDDDLEDDGDGEDYDFVDEEYDEEIDDEDDEEWDDFEFGGYSKMTLKTLDKNNEGAKTATSTTYEEAAPKSVKAIKIKVLKSKKKNKAFIKVSKSKKAHGYRIYISKYKNKRFKLVKTLKKNSKVKCTINKLKSGKRYYFKVRAYIKKGKKYLYTKYSAVKSIKIK